MYRVTRPRPGSRRPTARARPRGCEAVRPRLSPGVRPESSRPRCDGGPCGRRSATAPPSGRESGADGLRHLLAYLAYRLSTLRGQALGEIPRARAPETGTAFGTEVSESQRISEDRRQVFKRFRAWATSAAQTSKTGG